MPCYPYTYGSQLHPVLGLVYVIKDFAMDSSQNVIADRYSSWDEQINR